MSAGPAGRPGLVARDDGFRHEAFFYADEGDFLAGTAAFVRAAAAADEPVLVAVDAGKIAALHAVLDGDAETAVQFTDAVGGAVLIQEPLPAPPAGVEVHEFGVADLASVRRVASRHAAAAGLGDRAADVVLVADELATNSVRHGGGGGALRVWRHGTSLICEVRDRGRVVDPFVGRRRPVEGQSGGRGLWMVNQVCDLLQVRSSAAGTTVRAHISSAGGRQ